ncbi:hypothetical protein WJX84_002635 [Apatococcus fuscideae]|uniref:tRNA-guanine(15) transglycosylase-like domain-containing protein n=1 Tax=Apatococcus fuscideae TaxID=2026836 RepID=A0AAW1T0D6_9CHLO
MTRVRVFEIEASSQQARTGLIHTAHGTLKTPAMLLYTRRGGLLNLTPDMAATLPLPHAMQLDLYSFMQDSGLVYPEGCTTGIHVFGGGLTCPIMALGRELLHDSSSTGKGSRNGVFLPTHAGLRMITPGVQMEAAKKMQPDAMAALSTEVPAAASRKATNEAAKRSIRWLDECLQAMAQDKRLQKSTQMWAAVQGGRHLDLRADHAAAAATRKGISGFVIGGLHTGETLEQRQQMLQTSIAALPQDVPRMASGMGSTPEDIMQAVSQGIQASVADSDQTGATSRTEQNVVGCCKQDGDAAQTGSANSSTAEPTLPEAGSKGALQADSAGSSSADPTLPGRHTAGASRLQVLCMHTAHTRLPPSPSADPGNGGSGSA